MLPKKLRAGVDALKPLPPAAQALLFLMKQEETPAAAMAEALESDGEVSARVMQVLNFPLYAGRYPVEHLEEGISRFGGSTVLNVLLKDYLFTLPLDAPLYGMSVEDAWLHGVVSSLAIIEVIRENPRKEIPRLASTAGLLHDIGKMVMNSSFDAAPAQLADLCRQEDVIFIEAEVRTFGCHHAQAGAAVARHWGFPEGVAEAIENHHASPLPDPTALMDAVVLSNLVAKTIGVGLGSEGMNFAVDAGCYTRLGLDFNAFCRVCARTASTIPELKKAYSAHFQ